jgi:hypothetical protein
MAKMKTDEVRRLAKELGLGELDEVSVARLAKANDGPPEQRMRAILSALGVREVDESSVKSLCNMMGQSATEQEFVDAVFVGECPNCGNEKTRSGEEEPGIENPAVGICPKCKALWCTECGVPLSMKKLDCDNPDCWLNQDDEDDLPEPEL